MTYRQEVLLARRAAAAGIATVRLHYRGTGNSDDLPAGSVTVPTMAADARAALAWLRETTGDGPVGFVGVRFGALVAAAVAAEHPGAPLALWEPVVSGARYYREMFRAVKVASVRSGSADPERGGLLRELHEHGWVEAMAQRVDLDSYRDAAARDVAAELGAHPRPILLVGAGKELPRECRRVRASWTDAGHSVDELLVPQRYGWWFLRDPNDWAPIENDPETEELIGGTADWLTRTLGAADGD